MVEVSSAIGRLSQYLRKAERIAEFQELIRAKDEVLARYQPIFSSARISQLDEESFRSFLYFENNKHWTGLYRQGNRLTQNMDTLRHALGMLLDERRPLADRFDDALGQVKGLGKGLASAILLVAYPDRYGVWNNVAESAMKALSVWPDFGWGTTLGQRYERLNALLTEIASGLGVDLWTLDALWWAVLRAEEGGVAEGEEVLVGEAEGSVFRLERHLHDFLVNNWEMTDLGRDWQIYGESGDETAGYEYPTAVGRIDILAKHRTKPAWLVIELKRHRASDRVVGQLLRYMGWVKRHLAKPNDEVKGIIITPEIDESLRYALVAVKGQGITLMRYRVEFHLESAEGVA